MRSLFGTEPSRFGWLLVIVLLVLGASPSLASGRSAKRKGAPSITFWFLGWDAGTPIFNKMTSWDPEGREREQLFRMRDGKLLPVRPNALAKRIESLSQGTTESDPSPLRLVNLDEAKVEAMEDVVRQGDGSWPKLKPAKVRLEIHFKEKSGKDRILWQGTRAVRVYGDEGGPTVSLPRIGQDSISPDGKTAVVVLVVNDTSEPLLLRLDGQ
jgi:hypothetical protein